MTTLRQIEANRLNSLKSCGPRTASGKETSRRNALKHGLSGAGVVLPDDERDAIDRRKAEWANDFQMSNPHEQWLFTQFITATVQIDRCQEEERTLRTELAVRASACWEEDRQLTVAALAKKLPRTPDLVSLQLRQTPQGADWLIARWESLGGLLDQKGEWTDAQRLALDLLGVPAVLRDGPTKLDPIAPDDDPKSYRAALVAGEIARLKEARETFLPVLDAREQAAAELGLPRDLPRPLALLRLYEASCERRMRKALAALPKGGRGRKTTAPAATTAAPIDVTLIDPDDPLALPDRSLDDELAELRQLSEILKQKEAAEAPTPAVASRPSPAPFSGRIAPFSAVPVPVRASAEFEAILASTPRDGRRHPRRS